MSGRGYTPTHAAGWIKDADADWALSDESWRKFDGSGSPPPRPDWYGRRAPGLRLRPDQERVYSVARDLPLALRLSAPAGGQGASPGSLCALAVGLGSLAAAVLFLAILALCPREPEAPHFAGEVPTYPSCAGCGLAGKCP